MEYIYYKYSKGNFGDELNGWLWPKFFGADHVSPQDPYFLGIGTILEADHHLVAGLDAERKKIVFGSGIRPAHKPMAIDGSWDIQFVRGPLSAFSLGNQHEYIADSAYAIRLIENFADYQNCEKKYEVSFMPYYLSNTYFDWKAICKQLGFNYISPWSEQGVHHTLTEIASSKYVITEAMHGAIMADIFRIPWHRLVLSAPHFEGSQISEFKWMDVIFGLGLSHTKPTHIDFFSKKADSWLYWKTIGNQHLKKILDKKLSVEFFLKNNVTDQVLSKLSAPVDYCLSADGAIRVIDEKLQGKVDAVKSKYNV